MTFECHRASPAKDVHPRCLGRAGRLLGVVSRTFSPLTVKGALGAELWCAGTRERCVDSSSHVNRGSPLREKVEKHRQAADAITIVHRLLIYGWRSWGGRFTVTAPAPGSYPHTPDPVTTGVRE
ncbi:hypothetical protein ZHAS_00015115 [Anopheles sinensis]|uniref:Uncharacterized protein n=1 Tax=Anopheles sinensis TaxID=74873 RepID=A0A084WA28_ANOSI|nr:hypothetical protein ZHAS_00015115 [Anopheles sinensis]